MFGFLNYNFDESEISDFIEIEKLKEDVYLHMSNSFLKSINKLTFCELLKEEIPDISENILNNAKKCKKNERGDYLKDNNIKINLNNPTIINNLTVEIIKISIHHYENNLTILQEDYKKIHKIVDVNKKSGLLFLITELSIDPVHHYYISRLNYLIWDKTREYYRKIIEDLDDYQIFELKCHIITVYLESDRPDIPDYQEEPFEAFRETYNSETERKFYLILSFTKEQILSFKSNNYEIFYYTIYGMTDNEQKQKIIEYFYDLEQVQYWLNETLLGKVTLK